MNKILHALYGLKWNPFNPDIPTEALYIPPPMESFIWRIENNHVQEGGFAMIVGDPGTGKSCLLRLLSQKLNQVQGLTVGTFTHPQSSLRDFYHELGDLFDIPIKAHNRWHSFKSLRRTATSMILKIYSPLSLPVMIYCWTGFVQPPAYFRWVAGFVNEYRWNMLHHNSCLIASAIYLKKRVIPCLCQKASCRLCVITR
jgi:energy-coupling factor transporter ATP-binding protein EcfA2